MDWLLEIIRAIFSVMFDLGRRAALRDRSRPRWFNYSLAASYYLLPALIVVSVFISWKITVIVIGLFLVSLVAGAMTETDDIGAH